MPGHPDLALYLYGVRLRDGAQTPPGWQVSGVEPDSFVELIPLSRLMMVSSRVRRADFDCTHPAHQASDPHWIAARVADHHRVDQDVCRMGAYLPFGFGTLFSCADRAAGVLNSIEPTLLAALSELAGQAEWVLSLDIDDSAHADYVQRHDHRLAQLARAAAEAREGTGFLLQRQADKARSLARTTHLEGCVTQVTQALAGVGVSAQLEAARGRTRWHFLAPSHCEGLTNALESLASRLECAGITLRLDGPWPAYAYARSLLSETLAYA